MRALVCATGLVIGLCACDTGQPKVETPPPTKSITELKQSSQSELSPEELEEERRKAGFKDPDELAAENIEQMKKGEREYVKTRLEEHREMLTSLRGLVDRVEKEAPKWAKAKDPQGAFDKFSEKYKEDTAALDETYKKLMEGGSQIDIQAKLVGAFRAFEDLNGDLGPEISGEEGFPKYISDLRSQLDEIEGELGVIEKDETLKVNESYVPEDK
ncbi:MAG: hypothetical protein H6712_13355 [Myxococcales bacterium]|nr:hypothetical protein [Myxococcales bacterium]MCB9714848.1 hypothetical protein [Myxococcales bacterium]